MSVEEKIKGKFERLLAEGKGVFEECGWDGQEWKRTYPSPTDYLRFRTEGLNLIKRACGEESEHYQQLRRLAENEITLNPFYYHQCYGVLEAAYRDFSEGFLFDLRAMVRADLLGNFIEQAEALLDEGYYVPAASLVGAVLEDTLRRICDQQNVSYPEKTNINALNTLLAKATVYNKLAQKEITAKADIRNNADHGKFNQFTESDVKDMVKWVQRFASEHLK